MTAPDDIDLLVVTCDAYADVWGPFFAFFRRQWPDCPYPIHVLSNHAEAGEPDVAAVKVGDDVDWSSNLIAALDRLERRYVLVLLEDFLLWQPVDSARIAGLADVVRRTDAVGLRLVPKPPAPKADAAPDVGTLTPGSPYRLSFQAGLWDRVALRDLLRPGESAWQAEHDGSRRADALGRPFLGMTAMPHADWPVHYMNGVIKRKWTPEAVAACAAAGVPIDLERRAVCNWYDQLRRRRGFKAATRGATALARHLLPRALYHRLRAHPRLRRIVY